VITRRQTLLAGGVVGLLGSLLGSRGGAAQTESAPTLFIGTYGADEPNRATFPFLLARGVVRAGQSATILLMGEGTKLLGPGVLEGITASGPPPLREIYADLLRVPLAVCMGCGRARGITDADVAAFNAQWVTNPQVDTLIASAQLVVSF
jgi:predicted peroxiredoxin